MFQLMWERQFHLFTVLRPLLWTRVGRHGSTQSCQQIRLGDLHRLAAGRGSGRYGRRSQMPSPKRKLRLRGVGHG